MCAHDGSGNLLGISDLRKTSENVKFILDEFVLNTIPTPFKYSHVEQGIEKKLINKFTDANVGAHVYSILI